VFCELRLSRETIVCISRGEKFLNIFLIERKPLRLDVGTTFPSCTDTLVSMNPKKLKCIKESISGSFYLASLIGILDSDEELPVILFCPNIGKESGTKTSNMELSCR